MSSAEDIISNEILNKVWEPLWFKTPYLSNEVSIIISSGLYEGFIVQIISSKSYLK